MGTARPALVWAKAMTPPEDNRAAQLEQQVRLLAAGLGFRPDDPGNAVPADVVALAREGRQLEAIKTLRKSRRLGLVRAKRIVDAAAD